MNDQELAVMEKLHEGQLAILSEFDRVCRAHDIPYCIAGGTLLGAVRHKDFIPWDDDMDVYMKRENYEKLLKYVDEFKEPYKFLLPDGTENCFWDYTARLVSTNCRLKHNEAENSFYQHTNNEFLFLDIFPLDQTYSGARHALQALQLKIIYGLAMSRRYKVSYDDYPSLISKLEAFVLSKVGALCRMDKLYARYSRIQRKYNGRTDTTHEFPSSITAKYLGKLNYGAGWHDETTEMTIRGKSVLAPKAYEEVLRSLYGDYMALPPEDKRVPEHVDSLLQIEFIGEGA